MSYFPLDDGYQALITDRREREGIQRITLYAGEMTATVMDPNNKVVGRFRIPEKRSRLEPIEILISREAEKIISHNLKK
jgi:hypothetical protein